MLRGTTSALLFPGILALAGFHCASQPPPPPPPPETPPPPASTASWTVPDVPLARRTILLQPPVTGPDASAIEPIAADPPALTEKTQWVYDLRFDKGELYLAGVHKVDLPSPRATPRVMGRFALEIYEGRALLERVRFDFPGLGASEGPTDKKAQALHARVSFTAKLRSRVGVMLPGTSRGTKLEIWDRATNRRWPLPWPASEMTTPPESAPDGGEGGA